MSKSNTVITKKLSHDEVVDTLYGYMVLGTSAADTCKKLGFTEKDTGSSRSAWRKLQPLYQSYGFPKRYKTAYHAIDRTKLSDYVANNWNRYCTEEDLLAFFPEITTDFEREISNDTDRIYIVNPENDNTVEIEDTKANKKTTKPKNKNVTKTRKPRKKQNKTEILPAVNIEDLPKDVDIDATDMVFEHIDDTNTKKKNSSDTIGVLDIFLPNLIIFIFVGIAYILLKQFEIITISSDEIFNLFYMLKFLFLYSSILSFIFSLIRHTTYYNITYVILGISFGVFFGFIARGNYIVGILCLIVGLLLKFIVKKKLLK